MSGKLTVSSELGQGTTFTLTIRFDLPQEQADIDRSTTAIGPSELLSLQFQPANILLVEDNPTNQQVARELLESTGLTVTIASDGLKAIDAVKHEHFDLVLMDVQMPRMDGYQATAVIRSDDRFKELPIIAMTAHALFSDQEKCLEAGMNDHVGKPVEPGASTRP
ncbi:response regulator [Candidatus Reidiella endopervernicosa]|uniref:Response regulator n=2 Tax=Candidatus Reidiella endopervernicosa TaxID=2738883 RepID=A0A6N0HYC7_9GAMM|nr:response regulator [Candidatus Reidiella endopervernicosa]